MKKQHKMIIEQIFIVVKKNKKCVRFLMIYKENEEKWKGEKILILKIIAVMNKVKMKAFHFKTIKLIKKINNQLNNLIIMILESLIFLMV